MPPPDGAARPRVLLLGDALARPDGLERALARAGFAVAEGGPDPDEGAPSAVLIAAAHADAELAAILDTVDCVYGPSTPRLVVLSGRSPDGPARALALGADDAVGTPVHLGELATRIGLRIRDRAGSLSEPHAAMLGGAPSPPRDANGVDALTGCGTPGALESRLHEEFERARRYALSFSLVLLDVDRLRELTEEHGAEVGDRILAGVGGILRSGARTSDFVCRYSGDEFAMLLPETDAAGARQSVYRVRDRLGVEAFDGVDDAAQPRVTAGIVTFPHPAAGGIGDLFALAEAALLRARGQTGERIGTAEAVAT